VRIESSVTSISWIPSGALDALPDVPPALARAHCDDPPPDRIETVAALRRSGTFRAVNDLRGWMEVEGGRVVGAGHVGGGAVDSPGLDLAPEPVGFAGVELPLIRPEPEVGLRSARFLQTVGGRIGLPLPRPVPGKPYPRLGPATAWTTLELTIWGDGRSRGTLVGASPFPSHWVYDAHGAVVTKQEALDLANWWQDAWSDASPWEPGDEAAAITSLERELARSLLHSGASMEHRTLGTGDTLVEQGESGSALFLLLIGTLDVEVDGRTVAQAGAGAIVGERAVLEGGTRTATLRAATPCRVAVVPAGRIGRAELRQLSRGHRRERR
jgi:hypothetical protein